MKLEEFNIGQEYLYEKLEKFESNDNYEFNEYGKFFLGQNFITIENNKGQVVSFMLNSATSNSSYFKCIYSDFN